MVIDMSWTNNDKTKAVQTKESDKGKYALRKKAMLEQIKQAQENNKSFLCLGIWGEPKSAKSATAMDLLTEEDIKKLNNEGFVTMKKNKVGSFIVKNKNFTRFV